MSNMMENTFEHHVTLSHNVLIHFECIVSICYEWLNGWLNMVVLIVDLSQMGKWELESDEDEKPTNVHHQVLKDGEGSYMVEDSQDAYALDKEEVKDAEHYQSSNGAPTDIGSSHTVQTKPNWRTSPTLLSGISQHQMSALLTINGHLMPKNWRS